MPPSTPSRNAKRAVAIVEDEKELLAAYSSCLRRHGYVSVYTFVTGEDFLRAIKDRKVEPDLALVDYRLPGEDGMKVAKKAVGFRAGMKVIVTTADDALLKLARGAGFDFLQKPFSLETLAQVLDRI